MKIAFCTLGCKVNQYESQALSELFIKRGHKIVHQDENADAFIINSCTVTASSDAKSRKTVNSIRRRNPDAVVALMGCFPQAFPDKAKNVKAADIVLGTRDRAQVVELVENCFKQKNKTFGITEHQKCAEIENLSITSFAERTRAFVKIQDGCNRFCSYCIIPYARGRICSKPLDELEKEVKALSQNGYTEIVLVGIDLSTYGKEFGKTLTDAVETVSKIEGIRRIRLGSLEPEVIEDSDIERLSKIDAFCPQFHLSLQSGCDETLKRMNRHYNSSEYETIVNKIRRAFKNASITTDVMVGFAGESDEEFKKSLDFVTKIRFLKVHTFPYSVREGTRAAEFENQIGAEIKKKRAAIMIEQTEKIRTEILSEKLNQTVSILVEGKIRGGYFMGYTPDYIPVYLKKYSGAVGEVIDVKLCSLYLDGCEGIEI